MAPLPLGSIDVSSDRHGDLDPQSARAGPQRANAPGRARPLEIYMEGNVVFRQGERVIYATRMYYDVTNQRGHRAGRRSAHARTQV